MNPLSWIGSLISGLVSLAAGWITGRNAVGARNNSPEMVTNATARDDQKEADKIQSTLAKADKGDAKAQEEIRNEAAE